MFHYKGNIFISKDLIAFSGEKNIHCDDMFYLQLYYSDYNCKLNYIIVCFADYSFVSVL